MKTIRKNQYTPVFTPRFHLSDAAVAGMEIRVKQAQRTLSVNDAFKLVQSGGGGDLLEQIKARLPQWCKKTGTPLYLSWAVCGKTNPADLKLFLDGWSLALPLGQLEIMLDAHGLTADEALGKAHQLFDGLQGLGIRRGLFHSRPLEFDLDKICAGIDLLKLKKGVLREMKEDLTTAAQGHCFIERLNAENIGIVADDLYSKADVTCAIMMGIKYGQGYFLSRNQPPQKIGKALEKKPRGDFYGRGSCLFPNFCWY